MKRERLLSHEFVEYIPDDLQEGKIYVSTAFNTVTHKCCCGCGNAVITPLSPTDWKLTFDGESVSLFPSIGNWSIECRSHYWIRNNRVEWADRWSKEQINAGRASDRAAKERYYGSHKPTGNMHVGEADPVSTYWSKLKRWWSKD